MTDITSQLSSGALILSGDGDSIYKFYGDASSAESRRLDWLRVSISRDGNACPAPIGGALLTPGATYVPSIDEPSGIGALVVEANSGTRWVKNTDGHWQTDGGRLLDWADLAHPIVRSQGVQA